MAGLLKTLDAAARIVYVLRPRKAGEGIFSDVKLPDGTIIRRVDEDVHRRALDAAQSAFREKGG